MSSIAKAAEAQREAQKLRDDAVRELRNYLSGEIEKATGRRNDRLARWLTAEIARREMTAARE